MASKGLLKQWNCNVIHSVKMTDVVLQNGESLQSQRIRNVIFCLKSNLKTGFEGFLDN